MPRPAPPPRFAVAQPALTRVTKAVPQANLTSLDPIWTTANITRHHGHIVYDTLYGTGARFKLQSEMAEGAVAADDRKRVTITLRSGPRLET